MSLYLIRTLHADGVTTGSATYSAEQVGDYQFVMGVLLSSSYQVTVLYSGVNLSKEF